MSDIANSAALNSAINDGNGKGANLLAWCQTEDFEKSKRHKNLSQQVKPQIQAKRIGQRVTAEQKRAKHKNENQTVDGTAVLQKTNLLGTQPQPNKQREKGFRFDSQQDEQNETR